MYAHQRSFTRLTVLLLTAFGMPATGLAALPVGDQAVWSKSGDEGDELARLAWMAGSWVMEAGPRRIEEHWTAARGATMFGVSRTIVNGKLREFEFLRIVRDGETFAYLAQPGGRSPATAFKMTAQEGKRVVFENPEHDFPTRIEYWLEDDGSLKAVVSGKGDQKLEFHWQPMKP